MHDIKTNMHITYTLNEYTKDRNAGPGNYVAAGEKPVKINSYKISIIAVNTPNDPDIIILTNTIYHPTFLANITSTKHFQLKEIYLDKKHSQLYKKKITQYLLKKYNRNFFL